MVKLKGYNFACGSLKLNTNCENISLGSFAPMDEDSNTSKDMKQNNDERNMQHQLRYKGEQCAKASIDVWCNCHSTSWHHLLQLVQNGNIDMLFWSYNGTAASETTAENSMLFKHPFICVHLEHLY
jgi:hypothetical protein